MDWSDRYKQVLQRGPRAADREGRAPLSVLSAGGKVGEPVGRRC